MFEYQVINRITNTTTIKIAKSKAYLMWMYYHVYAEQSHNIGSSCGYDVEKQMWVVEIY